MSKQQEYVSVHFRMLMCANNTATIVVITITKIEDKSTNKRSIAYFLQDRARFYTAEIILALEYLHGMCVIYRDLKVGVYIYIYIYIYVYIYVCMYVCIRVDCLKYLDGYVDCGSETLTVTVETLSISQLRHFYYHS
jgi:hypothetical protein